MTAKASIRPDRSVLRGGYHGRGGQFYCRIPDGVAEKGVDPGLHACRSGKCSRNAGLSRRVVIIKERINIEELLKSLQELLAIESVAGGIRKSPSETAWPSAGLHAFPLPTYGLSYKERRRAVRLCGNRRGCGDHRLPWPSGRGPRGRWLALSALCRNHRRRTAVRPRHSGRCLAATCMVESWALP